MHNRNRVVWFGMFLGISLLGCPPAAKDAKDAKQEAGEASSGSAEQSADEKEEEKPSDSAPAPRGGW